MVSLIIATYNRKHLLLPLLHKLQKQTFKDFEVIVADDGSSDGTITAVKKKKAEVSYILKIVSQKDKGYRLSKSRNNGAKLAEKRQLVFIDDDCLPAKDFLKSYYQAYSPNHLLRGDIIMVASFQKLENIIRRYPGNQNGLWGGNFSLSKDLFFQIGGFNEKIVNQGKEDTELQRRLNKHNIKTIAVKNAHVYHLGRPQAGKLWLNKLIDQK